jgi:hypothetical protein
MKHHHIHAMYQFQPIPLLLGCEIASGTSGQGEFDGCERVVDVYGIQPRPDTLHWIGPCVCLRWSWSSLVRPRVHGHGEVFHTDLDQIEQFEDLSLVHAKATM